jgi:hypothetical protein
MAIPDDIRRFILGSIESVPALEALLLMHRDPEREWTASNLAAALYMEPPRIGSILADLVVRGLCRRRDDGEARYSALPSTSELARRLDQLADVYAHHLIAVTNLIHSRPRTNARSFAGTEGEGPSDRRTGLCSLLPASSWSLTPVSSGGCGSLTRPSASCAF